ncbi:MULTISPECIES: hypothetical protein [unclassified Streptomyces]|uniref:hypothetical protein n=1 Tax=unclassified Streptomyces TaxID=2593676 RepID=UPI0004C04C49|nr:MULTISPECIES: hypothetical protein [unclassified Streptomyces]KOV96109.1 hypothetical protein ADL04_18140 [Streptomyces sp. NRRL B-3648]
MRTSHKAGLAAAAAVLGLAGMLAPTASAQPRAAAAPSDCPKYYFCGYKQANFEALAFTFKDCYLQEIPDGLNSGGSWYNNQSTGTKARMYDKNKRLIYTTPGAPSSDAHGDWGPVWYIDAC